MNAANVTNPLANAQASISTKNFIPQRDPMNARNMENPSLQHLMLFNTRESTIEKDLRLEGKVLSPCSL